MANNVSIESEAEGKKFAGMVSVTSPTIGECFALFEKGLADIRSRHCIHFLEGIESFKARIKVERGAECVWELDTFFESEVV